MAKRSAKQKANDKRLSKGLKPIKQTKKKKSTKKGGVRKTARRAYKPKKRTAKKRKSNESDRWKFH